jgi:hypothetical protein
VGILDSFERGLERAVNGAFAKTFRSGVQPVEIAAALRRQLDTKAQVVSRDRVLVPNLFVVRLAPADFERMNALGATLLDELTRLVLEHAQRQRFQFSGGIGITLRSDSGLAEGVVLVDSESAGGTIAWTAVLDVNGMRYPLKPGRTVVGRGAEADITVDDPGISRQHLEISWDGNTAVARDLGSTNGSQVNGQPLTAAALQADSVVTLGQSVITLRLVPQASAPASTATPPAAPTAQPDNFWG